MNEKPQAADSDGDMFYSTMIHSSTCGAIINNVGHYFSGGHRCTEIRNFFFLNIYKMKKKKNIFCKIPCSLDNIRIQW